MGCTSQSASCCLAYIWKNQLNRKWQTSLHPLSLLKNEGSCISNMELSVGSQASNLLARPSLWWQFRIFDSIQLFGHHSVRKATDCTEALFQGRLVTCNIANWKRNDLPNCITKPLDNKDIINNRQIPTTHTCFTYQLWTLLHPNPFDSQSIPNRG